MKQTIPFVKDLHFKTMINEITSISLEHTLDFDNDKNIVGDFLLGGTYKVTETSIVEEAFEEKIPVLITIDNKYDIATAKIIIDDFYYELVNSNTLKLNIELCIEGLEKIEILEEEDHDDMKTILEKEAEVLKEELRFDDDDVLEANEKIDSLFANLSDSEESFAAYLVYIMRSGDTIEEILNKYKVSLEELKNYNDLENIQVGSKIIIPSHNDE